MFPTPLGTISVIPFDLRFSNLKIGEGGMGTRDRDETLSIFIKIEILYLQIWQGLRHANQTTYKNFFTF